MHPNPELREPMVCYISDEARRTLDEVRAENGQPPWVWARPGTIATQEPEMPLEAIKCACKCGQSFIPHRQGVRYKYGHKPKIQSAQEPPQAPKPTAAGTLQDARNQYAVTADMMRREMKLLDAQIECADDEMEKVREQRDAFVGKMNDAIAGCQATKDAAVDRHGFLSTCIEALDELNGIRKPESVETPAHPIAGLKDAAEFDRMFSKESVSQ